MHTQVSSLPVNKLLLNLTEWQFVSPIAICQLGTNLLLTIVTPVNWCVDVECVCAKTVEAQFTNSPDESTGVLIVD